MPCVTAVLVGLAMGFETCAAAFGDKRILHDDIDEQVPVHGVEDVLGNILLEDAMRLRIFIDPLVGGHDSEPVAAASADGRILTSWLSTGFPQGTAPFLCPSVRSQGGFCGSSGSRSLPSCKYSTSAGMRNRNRWELYA